MKPQCPLTGSHECAEGRRVPPREGQLEGAAAWVACPGEKWTLEMRISRRKNKDVLIQVWSLSVQGEPSPAAQGQLGGCRKVLAQGGAA